MEDPYTTILCRIFITDSTTIIFATVINEKQLEVGEGLSQYAVDTAIQILFCIVNGDYD
jgi:hypothetical protein